MKKKKIFFLLASLLIWTSCSNEDIPVNVLDTTKITEVNTYYVRPRWGFVEIVTDEGYTGLLGASG